MNFSADLYRRALHFAATAHGAQKVPGSEHSYVVHLTSVAAEVLALAMSGVEEFDVELAMTCALLHDTLEDTKTAEEAVGAAFGQAVLDGVRALTKNEALPKAQRMADSLARIVAQPREIALVKLADRITNLEPPPHYWTQAKCAAYREEARQISAALGHASPALKRRLEEKIESYAAYT